MYCTDKEWCEDCMKEIALQVAKDNPDKKVVTARFEVKTE